VVSNATRTVSSGQIFLRRGIGASVGHLPEIGLPTEIQRKLAATLPVARPKRPVLKDHRPLEPICGNIVGAVVTRPIGAVLAVLAVRLGAGDGRRIQRRSRRIGGGTAERDAPPHRGAAAPRHQRGRMTVAALAPPGSSTILTDATVKIGAKVIAHARYTVFQMAEVAVPRDLFRRILLMIDDLRPRGVARC
jgi:hypothetical protein